MKKIGSFACEIVLMLSAFSGSMAMAGGRPLRLMALVAGILVVADCHGELPDPVR
jgi:hypothetical protein